MLLILTVLAVGQTADKAVSTYATNGVMISLTNLSPLSDCESQNIMGQLKKVKVRENLAYLRLKVNGEMENVEFPLERLSPADRSIVFKHMVRTGLILRISGYSCTQEAAITAFSIDRIY